MTSSSSPPSTSTSASSPSPSPSSPVLHSGQLKKLGSRVLVDQWHYRYFVLTPQRLTYYADKAAALRDPTNPKASLPLDSAFHLHEDPAPDHPSTSHLLLLSSHQRTIRLRADSLQDKQHWMAAIRQAQAKATHSSDAAAAAGPSSSEVSASLSVAPPAAEDESPTSLSDPTESKWPNRAVSIDASERPSTSLPSHSASVSVEVSLPSPNFSTKRTTSQPLTLPTFPFTSRAQSRSAKRDLRVQRLFQLEQAVHILGSFSCGHQRDIRLHGTLYVGSSHLLFRPTLFFTTAIPAIIPVASITRVEATSDHRLFLRHGVRLCTARGDHIFASMTSGQRDLARMMIGAVVDRTRKGPDADGEASINLGGGWVGEDEDEDEEAQEGEAGTQIAQPPLRKAVTHLDFGEVRPPQDNGEGLDMRDVLTTSFPFTSHVFFALFLSDSAPCPLRLLHDARGDTDYHVSAWKDAVAVTGDAAVQGQVMRDLSAVIDPHVPGHTTTRVLKVQKRSVYALNRVVVETAAAFPDMTFGSCLHHVDVWTITDTADGRCELRVTQGIRYRKLPSALKTIKATVEGRGYANGKADCELWNRLAQEWMAGHPEEVQWAVANPEAPARPADLHVSETRRRSVSARTPQSMRPAGGVLQSLPVASAVKGGDGAALAAARAKRAARLRQNLPFLSVVGVLLVAVVVMFHPTSIPPQLVTAMVGSVGCGLLVLVLKRLSQIQEDVRYGNRLTNALLEAEKKRHSVG